jgi:hypothetical protein
MGGGIAQHGAIGLKEGRRSTGAVSQAAKGHAFAIADATK